MRICNIYENELRQLLIRKGQGCEQKSGLGIKAVGLQRQVTDNEAHLAVAPTVAAFCWICSQPSIATHAQAVRRPARHGCGLAYWKARSFACDSSLPVCKQEQGKQRLCMSERLRPLLRPDYISEHIQYAMLVSCLCLWCRQYTFVNARTSHDCLTAEPGVGYSQSWRLHNRLRA